jgi:hypothetical protein
MEEKTNLYIPTKCKVGLQLREGTYTGKLGYIIYHDGKVWRKETSWEGWRHKEGQMTSSWDYKKQEYTFNTPIFGVEPIEFDNVPTEGFVLNKKAGGYSSGWNHRQTYCRVYDPRGWEFEVNIPNLLYILQECSSYKGKGLEGEFVYSWEGKDLVLLPVSSPDYKECMKFTELQSKKIGKKDLVEGCTYLTSQMQKVVYLGQHLINEETYYNKTSIEDGGKIYSPVKKHVFRAPGKFDDYRSYLFVTSFSRFKSKVSDDVDPEFATYIDELQKSKYYSEADHLVVEPIVSEETKRFYFRGWNETIYKFGEITTKEELNNSRRRMDRSKVEGEKKYDIFTIKKLRRYWGGGDYYDDQYDLEGTFTKEEVLEKYGMLVRIHKNGYKEEV